MGPATKPWAIAGASITSAGSVSASSKWTNWSPHDRPLPPIHRPRVSRFAGAFSVIVMTKHTYTDDEGEWEAATWQDWRDIWLVIAAVAAVYTAGYFIWRNWEWIVSLI